MHARVVGCAAGQPGPVGQRAWHGIDLATSHDRAEQRDLHLVLASDADGSSGTPP